jgi:hypothetical protein
LTGVIVIVLVIGLVLELVAVKFILPFPLDGNPMAVLEFVQVYRLALVPVKFIEFTTSPLQKNKSDFG